MESDVSTFLPMFWPRLRHSNLHLLHSTASCEISYIGLTLRTRSVFDKANLSMAWLGLLQGRRFG